MVSGDNIIYLDVDGVLNPITKKGRHKHWADYKKYDVHIAFAGKYRIWLSVEMCQALLAVANKYDAEIVWSTTWNDEANQCIAPIVGFPELRVVRYDETSDSSLYGGSSMDNCGKLPYVSVDAENKNVVWIDDYLGPHDLQWVDDRNMWSKTLAIKPHSSVGLTKDHIDKIDRFFCEV